jgi:exodeoxyribonuclease VII small subunit
VNNKSYEEALAELEAVVKKLENGDLTLEQSIEYFQKGVELTKYCNKMLDETERKITVLIENAKGEATEQELPGIE